MTKQTMMSLVAGALLLAIGVFIGFMITQSGNNKVAYTEGNQNSSALTAQVMNARLTQSSASTAASAKVSIGDYKPSDVLSVVPLDESDDSIAWVYCGSQGPGFWLDVDYEPYNPYWCDIKYGSAVGAFDVSLNGDDDKLSRIVGDVPRDDQRIWEINCPLLGLGDDVINVDVDYDPDPGYWCRVAQGSVASAPDISIDASVNTRGDFESQYVLSKRDVASIQKILQNQGYYEGAIDGILGSGMESGLRKYQEQNKLKVTGELDYYTLEHIVK
jgi:hypothetical protein